MMFPLVLNLAADRIPVAVTCRVLAFSKQAFYQWRKQPVTDRDWDDAHLINAAIDIHHDDPEFGYRFIADELAGAGIQAGRNDREHLPPPTTPRPPRPPHTHRIRNTPTNRSRGLTPNPNESTKL